MWSTTLIHSNSAILTSNIKALFSAFLLRLIFIVKATIWTFFTAVRGVNKEVSFSTSLTASSVRWLGAIGRCYLVRSTLLTVFTRGWVRLSRKCAWKAIYARYSLFSCNLPTTWRIQSLTRVTRTTSKAPYKAPSWIDNGVVAIRADFAKDMLYFLARRKRRKMQLITMVSIMSNFTKLPTKKFNSSP